MKPNICFNSTISLAILFVYIWLYILNPGMLLFVSIFPRLTDSIWDLYHLYTI